MDFNSHTKNALDFLMYSYFGVTFENKAEDILKAAVSKAYNDATMRAALSLKSKEKGADYDKWYADIKDKASFQALRFLLREWAIKRVIENLPKAKSENIDTWLESFDVWHEGLCDSLAGDKGFDYVYEELINANMENLKYSNNFGTVHNIDNQYFTYGNAQKLVNMTLKNLYIITSIAMIYDPMDVQNIKAKMWRDEYKWTVDKSGKFHIPLDSYIYQLTGIDSNKEYWSKIPTYDVYKSKKEHVKEKIASVSEECPKWIKKANEKRIRIMRTQLKEQRN